MAHLLAHGCVAQPPRRHPGREGRRARALCGAHSRRVLRDAWGRKPEPARHLAGKAVRAHCAAPTVGASCKTLGDESRNPPELMSKALGERLRSVLQETVGAFVELPEDALQLGILSGKATLGPNLQVKQDFFERLGLPVVLTAGQINSIEIDIPTTHPRTKPLIVHVKQVLVTVSPNPNVNTRRARLRAHERQWQRAGLQEEFDLDSTTGKIVQKLVDNVQIVVDNIHIRLEDTHTSQTRPRSAFADTGCDGAQACYASGLVIDSFRLRSFVVNGEGSKWQETCVKKIQRFLSKKIEFGRSSRSGGISGASGIGLYVHSGEQPMADPGSSSWREAMLAF
eukprot:COSAG01_NODE_15134_length_1370_cov_1.723839_1_plen_339_part_01